MGINKTKQALQALVQVVDLLQIWIENQIRRIKNIVKRKHISMCIVEFWKKPAEGTAHFEDMVWAVSHMLETYANIDSNLGECVTIEDFSWERLGKMNHPPVDCTYVGIHGCYYKAHNKNEVTNELHADRDYNTA